LNPGKLLKDWRAGGEEIKKATGMDTFSGDTADKVNYIICCLTEKNIVLLQTSKENISEKENQEINAVNIIIENSPASDEDTEEDNRDTDNTESETSEIHEDVFKDWKQSVKEEALQNAVDKVSEKTDGLAGKIKDNEAKLGTMKDFDVIDDSSDESSDEDTAVEYMPDGELVRKKSRGFKQLNNCKRFWKASLMVE
jgi:hypothetical protein